MPAMHLRQREFTYSACRPFTETKKRIQKFREAGDSQYIYQNMLDKACFQHDMAYGDFKDSTKSTASDKVLHEKVFNIAKNPKYDGYQRGLDSMVYIDFLIKTWSRTVRNENISNKELTEELNKAITKYTHLF